MKIFFDIETNGLWPEVDKVHCISWKHLPEVKDWEGTTHDVETILKVWNALEISIELIGHNIIDYDLPVLKKVYGWEPKPEVKITDTLVMSRLIYTEDKAMRHSLDAWGVRLGYPKVQHEDWTTYTPEMAKRCEGDVEITYKLYQNLLEQKFSEQSIDLEMDVAKIISRQTKYGVGFDEEEGGKLYALLLGLKEAKHKELRNLFCGFYQNKGEFTPKRDDKKRGYGAGCKFTRIKFTEYNPGSRDHNIYCFKRKYNWKPKALTKNGNVAFDEDVLKNLKYPEAKPLMEYLVLNKRISSLAEGDTALLKMVKNGRMYGQVVTNGAVTGRMTHFNPNLGNIVATYSAYGKEFRALFGIPNAEKNSKSLVGCDASGLELRCLAGYLKRFDKGTYIKYAVDGTDIHGINRKNCGIKDRDTMKTFYYAYIFGASDIKLGKILGGGRQLGTQARMKLEVSLPALKRLKDSILDRLKTRDYLKGLDGRRLHIRSPHAALNTLCQGAGAVIMKKALVICDSMLQDKYVPGIDYEFVLNVHDEWQIECNAEYAKDIGETSVLAMEQAGRDLKFPCPITGEYKIGKRWNETH